MRPNFFAPAITILCFLALVACSNLDSRPGVAHPAGSAATASDSAKTEPTPAVPDSNVKAGQAVKQPASADDGTLTEGSAGMNLPPFGLADVRTALRQMYAIDEPNGGDGTTYAIPDSMYNALPLPVKFTYNMIHCEQYSQMCDMLPRHAHEADRIYGETTDYLPEFSWSDKQIDFFKENRDSVEKLMKMTIEAQHRVGLNTLDAIVAMNGTGMIPFLIDACPADSSNHYILTALMLLMNNNKYPGFLSSTSYRKLYASETDSYSRYLVYTKANRDLIIQRADNFYKDLPMHQQE